MPETCRVIYDNKSQLLHQVGICRQFHIWCTDTHTSNLQVHFIVANDIISPKSHCCAALTYSSITHKSALLNLHCSNGYANAQKCYVIYIFPAFLKIEHKLYVAKNFGVSPNFLPPIKIRVPCIAILFYYKQPKRCSFKLSFIYCVMTLHVSVLIWPCHSEVDTRAWTSFNRF